MAFKRHLLFLVNGHSYKFNNAIMLLNLRSSSSSGSMSKRGKRAPSPEEEDNSKDEEVKGFGPMLLYDHSCRQSYMEKT